MIHLDNYQNYILDYLENNLPENLKEEFNEFLHRYPEIMQEFNEYASINFPAEKISYPSKDKLKYESFTLNIPVNNINYKHFIIADIEGDLHVDQQSDLKNFLILHPQLKDETDIYKSLYFRDNITKYPYKKLLKGTSKNPNFGVAAQISNSHIPHVCCGLKFSRALNLRFLEMPLKKIIKLVFHKK